MMKKSPSVLQTLADPRYRHRLVTDPRTGGTGTGDRPTDVATDRPAPRPGWEPWMFDVLCSD